MHLRAGCSVDAALFLRVFTPVRQGERFDPDDSHVKHWIPELEHLPARTGHAPWSVPPRVLKQAGIALGGNSPRPALGLRRSRVKALEVYRRFRGG